MSGHLHQLAMMAQHSGHHYALLPKAVRLLVPHGPALAQGSQRVQAQARARVRVL